MPAFSAAVEEPARPVVYAGRYSGDLGGLPEGCEVLSDWDVLPDRLAVVAETADTLVVLDPVSFPFEAMAKVGRGAPLLVLLPPDLDADFLTAVFGEVVLQKLDFFDRIASPDAALLEGLRARYRLASCQILRLEGGEPAAAAREALALLESENGGPSSFGEGRYEAGRYWAERGAALAAASPYRAVCSARHGPRFNKALHLAQSAALEPRFAAALAARATDAPFDALEVGCGVGRWAASLDPARARYFGVDTSPEMVEAARANFPDLPPETFGVLAEDLALPHDDESFDLAFTVTVLHHNPPETRRRIFSEMWRVTRPGGRLVFLEDFVTGGWTEGSTVYPMPVGRFAEEVLEATDGQVVLDHVESIRYPHDDLARGGLLSLTRLGVPKRW